MAQRLQLMDDGVTIAGWGTGPRREGFVYVSEPRRLEFPSGPKVPETKRHLELRTLLYQVLMFAFAKTSSIGSEQFIYFNASDPRRCIAPDIFVRKGTPDALFPIWKTWEHGAPELAIEVVSDADSSKGAWLDKLERYREAGVDEVVRFHAEAPAEEQLRVWDRVDGDLVERIGSEGPMWCRTLGVAWVVVQHERLGATLRAVNAAGEVLLSEGEADALGRQRESEARQRESEARQRESEARQRESEARQREVLARQEEARGREEEARARRQAEARVAELEALLKANGHRAK